MFFAATSFVPIRATEPVAAKIKADTLVYDQRPMVLDGSGSAQGEGVTYQWSVTGGEEGKPSIDDADKVTARFTPPSWGVYHLTLTVTHGAEHGETRFNVLALNDPAKGNSLVFDGENKVLYKQATDALKGTVKLYLHVFNPPGWKASDKRGVVLMFHGGGWTRGSPEAQLQDAKYWASRGLVGITGEYRLGQREGIGPGECVADAKSAVRYLRVHAPDLGIDPTKIAVGGESAGAHIAACTGTVPAYNDPNDDLSVSCVPDALLLYFPYQMITTRGNRKDDMSPLHFVGPNTPPTLFIGGEEDGIAPAERGMEWGDKMKDGKNLFRYFIYRKTHHPSGKTDISKPGVPNDIFRQADLFLGALGFVQGEPTVTPMNPAAIAQLHVDPQTFHPLRNPKPGEQAAPPLPK